MLEREEKDVKFLLDLIGESGDDDCRFDGHGRVERGVWVGRCVPKRDLLPQAFVAQLWAESVFTGLDCLAQ